MAPKRKHQKEESTSKVGAALGDSLRGRFDRKTLKQDASAGTVLGIESIPDGLANGILAGVNPMAGLYAYIFGLAGGAFFTGSAFMAVGVTGAMALVVGDTDLGRYEDPTRAMFTLTLLVGVVMIVAGVLKLGKLVRFVPTAVMTGFVAAVGINIMLGQLGNLTGYEPDEGGRILNTLATFRHLFDINLWTTVVGVATIALIVVLNKTRLGALGMVVAVALGTLLAFGFDHFLSAEVATVSDIADIEPGLPFIGVPDFGAVITLIVPAMSLAFVGLIQGAAVTASVSRHGSGPRRMSKDFIGQGAGNVVSGLFQGMPVGASMSGSTLVAKSGARSRTALLVASAVMAAAVIFFSKVVGVVAMPALAALLIVVGWSAVKPEKVRSVLKTGTFQTTLMGITFVLTLVIPLQFAVLVGVALGLVLFVAQASNKLVVRQLNIQDDDSIRESVPVATLEAHDVVVLQPYGSLFFASAPTFEQQLPKITRASEGAVVIVRLRGVDELGLSLISVLRRYAARLMANGGTLKLVISSQHALRQLDREGIPELIGEGNVYMGGEWLAKTTIQAFRDAVAAQRPPDDSDE
ncbi:SulP family inorganic anion transporter [Demequina aurantiaca]|uniref:SulP family inorganic anion transporter n=1 Tax=Demequina aurantiaca TaxID=676200 RepID=UPI000A0566EF|nr:SulP family inorganic anion transporter [Demequina aurantiaca]